MVEGYCLLPESQGTVSKGQPLSFKCRRQFKYICRIKGQIHDTKRALGGLQTVYSCSVLYHPQTNSLRQCAINGKRVIIMNVSEISRIIEMAWEDRTPFEAIHAAYGLSESQVIKLMRQEIKPRSFQIWRKRVAGRRTKHLSRRDFTVGKFRCPTQKMR